MEEQIISQTTAWIKSVVIGCQFCPFAAKAMRMNSIRFVVLPEATIESTLTCLHQELRFLDISDKIETTLIILPDRFSDFLEYLDLVALAETLCAQEGYDGIYQVASFHPEYVFEGSDAEDPANYTNRSIYPMLHILREDSVSQAIEHYPDAEGIPQRNIAFAKEKGLLHMQMLRAACLRS